MASPLNYIKISNNIWPDSQAKRLHKKFINKHWKQVNIDEQEPITGIEPQNRSNQQSLDLTWDIQSANHL